MAALLLVAEKLPAAQLFFDEDLVLDPTGTEAEFGRINDVAVAPDGTIYVADNGFGLIHAFDEQGEHLRSFGTVGEGPGDLPPQLMSISVDGEGNLIVAGNRSSVGWLTPTGDLLRSLERGTSSFPQTVDALPDGGLVMTWTTGDWALDDFEPLLAHIIHGSAQDMIDFGRSSWWNSDYESAYAPSMLAAQTAPSADGHSIVFLQCNPYELRLYDLKGRPLQRTRDGDDGFVPEPQLPQISGNTILFRSSGQAGPLVVAPDVRIYVYASRIHPDDVDVDVDRAAHPEFEPRWQELMYAYEPDLTLLTVEEGSDVPRPLTFDPQGRLWCRGDTELPTLVRYRLRWEDDRAN